MEYVPSKFDNIVEYFNFAIEANQADCTKVIGCGAGGPRMKFETIPRKDGKFTDTAIALMDKLIFCHMCDDAPLDRVLTINPFCWVPKNFGGKYMEIPDLEARTIEEYWDALNDCDGWDRLIESGLPKHLIPCNEESEMFYE